MPRRNRGSLASSPLSAEGETFLLSGSDGCVRLAPSGIGPSDGEARTWESVSNLHVEMPIYTRGARRLASVIGMLLNGWDPAEAGNLAVSDLDSVDDEDGFGVDLGPPIGGVRYRRRDRVLVAVLLKTLGGAKGADWTAEDAAAVLALEPRFGGFPEWLQRRKLERQVLDRLTIHR